MVGRARAALITALMIGAAAAGTAHAAAGDLTYASCVADAVAGCERPPVAPRVMDGVIGMAYSPDSAELAFTGRNATSNALVRLRRDAATGAYPYLDCVRDAGCPTTLPYPWNSTAMAYSPDGRFVYASADEYGIAILGRGADGSLSWAGCISPARAGCAPIPIEFFHFRPSSMAISPDGTVLHAAINGFYTGVMTFDRHPVTGVLTYVGCVGDGAIGCTPPPVGLRAIEQPRHLSISPDGRDVYVSEGWNAGVTHLRPSGPGGRLEVIDCLARDVDSGNASCAAFTRPLGVTPLAMTADGLGVIVGGGTITELRRDPATGTLTFGSCFGPVSGCAGLPAGVSPTVMTGGVAQPVVSPDGRNVYGVSWEWSFPQPETVLTLRRSSAGELTWGGCIAAEPVAGCADLPPGVGAALVDSRLAAISPDGRSVSVAGYQGDGIITFTRDPGGPRNVAAPRVAPQQPRVGRSIVHTRGRWRGVPGRSYEARWLRCAAAAADCAIIGPAPRASRTVVAADAGHRLAIEVRATDAEGTSAWVRSAPSDVVPAPR